MAVCLMVASVGSTGSPKVETSSISLLLIVSHVASNWVEIEKQYAEN